MVLCSASGGGDCPRSTAGAEMGGGVHPVLERAPHAEGPFVARPSRQVAVGQVNCKRWCLRIRRSATGVDRENIEAHSSSGSTIGTIGCVVRACPKFSSAGPGGRSDSHTRRRTESATSAVGSYRRLISRAAPTVLFFPRARRAIATSLGSAAGRVSSPSAGPTRSRSGRLSSPSSIGVPCAFGRGPVSRFPLSGVT
jgi:hypothetical protein